ncbi:MAG: response regulator, partial [Pseudomonadota bacterium]
MSAGTGRSVLLVEDDALLGDLTAEVMRACGAGRVRLATSVGDALEAIDDADYDVVVIDLTLPDGSPEPLARRAEDRG